MQAFGEAFYGRTAAYDMALTEGREAIAAAICKNILNGEQTDKARALAAYTEAALAKLTEFDDTALLAGRWSFPVPEPTRAQ